MKYEIEVHPKYEENLKYWQIVRHFIDGKDEIKQYLRKINPKDSTQENLNRNREYRDGAIYMNVAARTRNALTGAVFRRDPTAELPPEIAYLMEDADGTGQSIFQVAKQVVGNIIEVGRHGLLVDYPRVESGETEEYIQAVDAKAKIVHYEAEHIINWECDDTGKLKSVTLQEGKDDYRILCYDDAGAYIQKIYDDGELTQIIEPKQSDGMAWKVIPFIFVGSEANTPKINTITMLDIVNVSRGHYQNSADYEDFLHYLAPTFAATVPSTQWRDEMMPDGFNIGPRGFIPLPENGTAMILQPQPNNAHAEAMTQKENQMVLIGARLIQPSKSGETAEAVRIRYSGENSILDNIAQNCSEAIEACLEFACSFMGGNPEDVMFTLNRDFFDTTITPQEIMAMIQLNDGGFIAKSDVTNRLRKTGYIEAARTDDEIAAELDSTL